MKDLLHKKWKPLFVSLLFGILTSISTFLWYSQNSAPPYAWDAAHMAIDGYKGYQKLQISSLEFITSSFYENRHWRANLLPIVLAPTLSLFQGNIYKSTSFIILLCSIILASLSWLLLRPTTSLYVAVAGTLTVMNFPLVFSHSTHFMSEVPVSMAIFVIIYGLFKQQQPNMISNFKPENIIIFGWLITCLIRLPEGILLGGPLLIYGTYQHHKGQWKSILKDIYPAFCLLIFVSLMFYKVWTTKQLNPGDATAASGFIVLLFLFFQRIKYTTTWGTKILLSSSTLSIFYIWGATELLDWVYSCTFGSASELRGLRPDLYSAILNFFKLSGFLPIFAWTVTVFFSLTTPLNKKADTKWRLHIILLLSIFPLIGLISKNGDMRYYTPLFAISLVFLFITLWQLTSGLLFLRRIFLILLSYISAHLVYSNFMFTLKSDSTYIPSSAIFSINEAYHRPMNDPYLPLVDLLEKHLDKDSNVALYLKSNAMVVSNGYLPLLPDIYKFPGKLIRNTDLPPLTHSAINFILSSEPISESDFPKFEKVTNLKISQYNEDFSLYFYRLKTKE